MRYLYNMKILKKIFTNRWTFFIVGGVLGHLADKFGYKVDTLMFWAIVFIPIVPWAILAVYLENKWKNESI